MVKFIFWLIFGFGTGFAFSQQTEASLLKRTEKLQDLLRSDPEKMFEENTKIIWEAQQLGYREIELMATLNQYKYYRHKVDFDNMISSSQHLLSKSKSYQNDVFEALARINLFEVYAFINLPDRAFEELRQAELILKDKGSDDSLMINTKSFLYTSYSNYYSLKGETEQRIKYSRLAMKENENFKTESHKLRLRYIAYVNLAAVFMDTEKIDSAQFYAELALSKDKYDLKDVKLLNYSTLSRVEIAKKNFEQALYYLKKAEEIKGYRNHINDLELYSSLLDVYQKLNDRENINKYRIKKDSLSLIIKESQNKSLHNILDDEKQNKVNQKPYYYAFIFITALFIIGTIFFFNKRKKILPNRENENQNYLGESFDTKKGDEYSRLLEMLKKKDPAFMIYFDEVFPEFLSRLLDINPNLIRSDLEFCTLLKLKIPTHEIAQYKNITTKSVQNKKYSIRKKLDIPTGVDIYSWFSQI